MPGRLVTRLASTATVAVAVLALSAHIGSPDTVWEGTAGPYPIRVIIRDPGVIPGLAEIVVRAPATGIQSVSVTAAIWNGGSGNAPPPDVAVRVPGDSTLWSARLWFMASSSYAVRVNLTGASGSGTAIAPFVARPTRVMPLPLSLRIVLVALGLFLAAGLVTIVISGTRESTVPAGMAVDPARRWTARIAGAVAAAVLAALLWFGNGWWNGEANAYAESIVANQPFRTDARVVIQNDRTALRITIADSLWRAMHDPTDPARERRGLSPLIPDHGKLMHAFLIGTVGDGFAHLHPLSVDSMQFTSDLPPLPAGQYRLFADIVHESGWSQTLTANVSVTGGTTAWTPTDADDAWSVAPATTDTVVGVTDKLHVAWSRGPSPIVRGADARLNFRVLNADGTVARIQLYLGMAGHLVLVRDDGNVYMHLHPMGTVSMAAMEAATMRRPGDTIPGRLGARLTAGQAMAPDQETTLPGELSFPYEFPAAGNYRVWVQFRQNGTIHTAAFRVTVADSAAAKR